MVNDREETATFTEATRKKILLVDDSTANLMRERTILAQEPYDVVTASDGEEAIETAVREVPDLILLDVLMPNMDGFEICRKLRKTRKAKSIPIIMVTPAGKGDGGTGYGIGCDDYVTTPLDSGELLSKVRNFLGPAAS